MFANTKFIIGCAVLLGFSAFAQPGPRSSSAAAVPIGVAQLTNSPNHLTNWAKLSTNTLATVAASAAQAATNGLGSSAFSSVVPLTNVWTASNLDFQRNVGISNGVSTPGILLGTNGTIKTSGAITSGGGVTASFIDAQLGNSSFALLTLSGTQIRNTSSVDGEINIGPNGNTYTNLGIYNNGIYIGDRNATISRSAAGQLSLTNILTKQTDYQTNTNPLIPDFTLGYQLFVTNAAFTFLAPAGVSATLGQTTVVLVTNSTASAVLVTAPANVHTQGTWYVTNVTSFTFFQYGQRFTNAYAFPLW